MSDEERLKHCNRCDQMLAVFKFANDPSRKDGKDSTCRECKVKQAAARRAKKRKEAASWGLQSYWAKKRAVKGANNV